MKRFGLFLLKYIERWGRCAGEVVLFGFRRGSFILGVVGCKLGVFRREIRNMGVIRDVV